MRLINRRVFEKTSSDNPSIIFYYLDSTFQFKRHKLVFRVKLSQTQKRKFNRYGKIPKITSKSEFLSTFTNKQFSKKVPLKRNKENWFKFNVNGQVYSVQFLNDVFVSGNCQEIIQELIKSQVFAK